MFCAVFFAQFQLFLTVVFMTTHVIRVGNEHTHTQTNPRINRMSLRRPFLFGMPSFFVCVCPFELRAQRLYFADIAVFIIRK